MTIIMTDLENVNFTRTDACAVSNDEAYEIKYAVHKLQNALAEAGYAPR